MSLTLSNLSVSNVSAGTGGSTPPSGDPYWNSVVLLTETVNTNGATNNTFLDSSSNAYTVATSGAVSQGSFSPFASGGGSMYFNGSANTVYSSSAGMNVGTGNFTMEGWFYFNDVTSTCAIMYSGNGSGSTPKIFIQLAQNGPGNLSTQITAAGGAYTAVSNNNVVTAGQWTHIALVRNSSAVNIYVNGVSVAAASNSSNVSGITNGFVVGNGTAGDIFPNYLNGYASNVRYTNTAVYTGNFSVPTSPLTAIAGTQLLLLATNAGIYDAAAKNDLYTLGNTQVSTAQAQFGTTSMAFNGSKLFIPGPGNNNFSYGSGDFTIEFWMRNSVSGVAETMFDQRGANIAMAAPAIYTSTGTDLIYYVQGTNQIIGTNAIPSIDTWYFVALSKNSGATKLYVNGTQVGSTFNDGVSYVANLQTSVGASADGPAPFSGYMQQLRITKGVGRYPNNFTAPSAPFPTN